MAARPSASGGSKPRQDPGKPNFDKRMSKRMSKDDMFFTSRPSRRPRPDKRVSRDDMYLRSQMASTSMAQFHIPAARGQPRQLTPVHSPDSPPQGPPSAVAGVLTPEPPNPGGIPIGMALGSPSHAPVAMSSWQPSLPAVSQEDEGHQAEPAQQPPAEATLQRTKTGRRKLFGLFGSRRHQEPPRPRPGPPPESVKSPDSLSSAAASPAASARPAEPNQPTRSNTTKAKYKPIVIRTSTEPLAESPRKESVPSRARRATESESSVRQQPARATGPSEGSLRPPNHAAAAAAAAAAAGGRLASPLLDVEIPSITLERYSVMFGNLLGPEQQPASSLLARRQATLDRLKTVNDRIAAQEEARAARLRQRRATSPLGAPSPSLALFPSPAPAPQPRAPPVPPSPRTRSNTSPALFRPPSAPASDAHRPRHHAAVARGRQGVLPAPAPSRGEAHAHAHAHAPTEEAGSGPAHPAHDGSYFGPGEPGLVLDSPGEMDEEDEGDEGGGDAVAFRPSKPAIPSPQWQMITPPTSAVGAPPKSSSTVSSSSSSSNASAPATAGNKPTTPSSSASSASAASAPIQPPPPPSSSPPHQSRTKPGPSVEIDEPDATLKNAVEISIARQISVSREQRQMLRPLQTSLRGRGPGARAAPGGGRLNRTKHSTPTLVVPQEDAAAHLAQHRKSERVVLEAA